MDAGTHSTGVVNITEITEKSLGLSVFIMVISQGGGNDGYNDIE